MVWGTRVKPLPMRNWTSGLERLFEALLTVMWVMLLSEGAVVRGAGRG